MVWTQMTAWGANSHFLSATGGVEEGGDWAARQLGESTREHLWSSNLLLWKRDRRSKKPSSPIVSWAPGYSIKMNAVNKFEKGASDNWGRPEKWQDFSGNNQSINHILKRFLCVPGMLCVFQKYLRRRWWIQLRTRGLGACFTLVFRRWLLVVLLLLAFQTVEEEQLCGGFYCVVFWRPGEHLRLPRLCIQHGYRMLISTERPCLTFGPC